MSYSYLFKYIVIGDSSVGKSCLLLQFLEKKFKFEHDTTIGVEFGSKIISIDTRDVKLQIWDTAGQETFRSITRSYYRGSIGVILVYDTTNRESFNNVAKWLDQTRSYANDKVCILLVGSKSDLQGKRVISYDEGMQFARANNLLFIQCSSKTGHNVDAVFTMAAENILKKIDKKEIDPTNESIGVKLGNAQLQKEIQDRKRNCIC